MISRISVLAAAAIGLATVGAGAASAVPAAERAELIDVDVIHAVTNRAGPPSSGANCSNAGPTNAADWVPTGWAVQGAKTAHFNVATVPAGLGSQTSVMQAGFDAWGAPAPGITVATDGTGTKPVANHSYDIMFGRAGGTTLAVTYTWRWTSGEIESDVLFNNKVAWTNISTEGDGCHETIAKYDVRNIATHEFGHVYGLGHPNPGRYETMWAYGYTGETVKWSLGAGDSAGLNSLY